MAAKKYFIQAVISAADRFSAPFRRIERTAFGRMGQRLGTLSRQSQQMGAHLHAALLPLTALGAGAPIAVKTFAGFETELAKVRGLVGVSKKELAVFESQLGGIGAVSGKGPKELAQSLFFVTSAGLRGKVALDVVRESAKASAAGMGEQALIADLMTSAVNAYGAANLSALSTANSLTEAIRLGKLEPTSLAGAMGQTLPIASTMGVKFSELSGIFAAMSRTGTGAEQAATQVGQIMNGIIKPSSMAAKAMKKVGLSSELLQKSVKQKGLFQTIVDLKEVMGGTNQGMVKIFRNIPAMRGIFDLLGSNFEDNKKIIEEMAESTGVLDEAFVAVKGTVGQTFLEVWSQFQFVLTDIGKRLAPLAMGLAWIAKAFMSFYNILPGPLKSLIAYMVALASVFAAVGIAATTGMLILGGVAPLFTLASSGAALLGTALTGVAGAMGAIGVASAWWLAPLILGLSVAAGLVYYYWDPISEFFASLWGGVEETNKTSLDNVAKAQEAFVLKLDKSHETVLGSLTQGIKNVSAAYWGMVSGPLEAAWKYITDIGTALQTGYEAPKIEPWDMSALRAVQDILDSIAAGFKWISDTFGVKAGPQQSPLAAIAKSPISKSALAPRPRSLTEISDEMIAEENARKAAEQDQKNRASLAWQIDSKWISDTFGVKAGPQQSPLAAIAKSPISNLDSIAAGFLRPAAARAGFVTTSAQSALGPAGDLGQAKPKASMVVKFEGAPAGTRVEVEEEEDLEVETDVGYNLAGGAWARQ